MTSLYGYKTLLLKMRGAVLTAKHNDWCPITLLLPDTNAILLLITHRKPL